MPCYFHFLFSPPPLSIKASGFVRQEPDLGTSGQNDGAEIGVKKVEKLEKRK